MPASLSVSIHFPVLFLGGVYIERPEEEKSVYFLYSRPIHYGHRNLVTRFAARHHGGLCGFEGNFRFQRFESF